MRVFTAVASGALLMQQATLVWGTQTRDLAALVGEAESRRDAEVLEVRSVRQYAVKSPRWDTDATMKAVMITSADGTKRYEVLETNATGMRYGILLKILDGEVQAAARKDREGNVNASNYELRPIAAKGTENGCSPVALLPKRRSRLTFEGQACVDMTHMAMVRMEGITCKRISFLVGKAHVVQEFRRIGDFWYSSESRSAADVRFFGRTELLIKYVSYKITAKGGAVITA